MVTFLTTARHRYTIDKYLKLWGVSLEQGVRVLPYELLFCLGSVTRGTYIFTDLDRLSPKHLKQAARWYKILKEQKATVLNDPAKFVGRLDLLQLLFREGHNHFNAYTLSHRHEARFPLFLRFDAGHDGPITDLIYDSESLEVEINRLRKSLQSPEPIVVEYLNYKEIDQRHYKYSHFRMGSKIIFAGMVCGQSWCLKGMEDYDDLIEDRELKASEMAIHNQTLMDRFEAAGIEFGRIDYAIVNGQVEVFEINTNPELGIPCPPALQRWFVRSRSYQELNESIWEYYQQSTEGLPITTPGKFDLRLLVMLIIWRLGLWARNFQGFLKKIF
ncbi:MAG: hypothetical protein ACQ9MH_10440 [Nitrospinales bacterium]